MSSKLFTVDDVFEWYKNIMSAHHRNIEWPKSTNKENTYLYRHLESFIKKCNELDLDMYLSKRLIRHVINEAKNKGLLRTGSSILTRNDIYLIARMKLIKEIEQMHSVIDSVKNVREFIKNISNNNEIIGILLNKKNLRSYANITCWFQEGKITKSYLAISKSCSYAISKLDADERIQFPSDTEILKCRYALLKNEMIKEDLIKIMDKDLIGEI